MTKVALIAHQFPSREHPYITEWAKGLVLAGVDLTIYTEKASDPSIGQDPLNEAFWKRVRVFNLLDSPWLSLKRNVRDNLKRLPHVPGATRHLLRTFSGKPLSVARRLYEYLPALGSKYDIVHFNGPQIAVRRFELGQLLGGKTLVSFRGQDIAFHPQRYDELLQNANHLHFISNHLLDLAKQRGYDGKRHTIIPPMVDTDFHHPPEERAEGGAANYILFTAARLEWVKGFEFALQAVALLKQRGVPVDYYIAGDGELKDAVLYTMHQLGIQENVHLLGWQTPAQIRDWMWKSDLYVLASVSEAFNNSVLQAQACGLPVVCSDEGGLPENVADGETGLLFTRRDAWDMADKIEILLRDDVLRRQMGISARQRTVKFFDLNKNVEKFNQLYQLIIEN